ncbi:MAG: hypothetical protein IJB50_04555 [Clostridia bacterium]|nr:hypothetical protein [Clostridia bacterium]
MTKKISICAIMTSLTLVFLFGSAYIPTGKIALLALASMCILVSVCECGIKFSWLQYVATSLLALLFIPSKGQVFLFIGIIGYYPILKLHIEGIKNIKIEWIVKIAFFNALLIVSYFVLKYVLLNYLSLSTIMDIVLANTFLIVLISEIVFIIYDYFLSFFARYYKDVISKKIKLR